MLLVGRNGIWPQVLLQHSHKKNCLGKLLATLEKWLAEHETKWRCCVIAYNNVVTVVPSSCIVLVLLILSVQLQCLVELLILVCEILLIAIIIIISIIITVTPGMHCLIAIFHANVGLAAPPLDFQSPQISILSIFGHKPKLFIFPLT